MLNYISNRYFNTLTSFFQDNWTFHSYSFEHFSSLVISLLIAFLLIYLLPKRVSRSFVDRIMLCFSLFVWISQVLKVFIKLNLENFDLLRDLPLELCNILTFLMPIVYIFRSRTLWFMIFFWIMAGTFQALVTPTLQQSFPHYEYWRYFIVHAGLVICVLYPAFQWGWTLNINHAVCSALGLNAVAFFMYHVNKFFGSNYMYVNEKPPGKTLYSLLSEWPYYILQLELVVILLFGLLLIPFYLTKNKKDLAI